MGRALGAGRRGASLRRVSTIASLLGLLAWPGSGATGEAASRVAYENARLTVRARAVDAGVLLQQIAEAAGVQVELLQAPTGFLTISLAFDGMPLDAGIRKVLEAAGANVSYVFVYTGSQGQSGLDRVMVTFGEGGEKAPTGTNAERRVIDDKVGREPQLTVEQLRKRGVPEDTIRLKVDEIRKRTNAERKVTGDEIGRELQQTVEKLRKRGVPEDAIRRKVDEELREEGLSAAEEAQLRDALGVRQ